jgi:hypothetical protein
MLTFAEESKRRITIGSNSQKCALTIVGETLTESTGNK